MSARSAAAFATAVGGSLSGADVGFAAVVTDSRALARGDCFVALVGPRFDGHEFVPQAAAAGAAMAVVARECDAPLPQVRVPDTLEALQRFAAAWRRGFDLPVVGITGSNGKTTLRAMCEAVLAPLGPLLATEGNRNNHIGLPLTLCRLDATHRAAVIEMGANHAGEIAMLAGLAAPRIGIVTNAGDAHLEGFGSREGVARAKGELFAALPADGTAIINADDAYAAYWLGVAGDRRVLRFGLAADAEVRAEGVEAVDEGAGSRFTLCLPGGDRAAVTLPLPGAHNVRNALAAAAAGHALGLDAARIAAGLAATHTPDGRLASRSAVGGARIIDDSYNANPDSLRAGIALLAGMHGTRVLALGEMGELGDAAAARHAEAGRAAREAGIDRLLAVGPMAGLAAEAFGDGGATFDEPAALAAALRGELARDWVVLVKGSRSAGMERVVAALDAGAADSEPTASGESHALSRH